MEITMKTHQVGRWVTREVLVRVNEDAIVISSGAFEGCDAGLETVGESLPKWIST